MSEKRDWEYWRTLHCEASLLASVLGLFNERRDSAANHMFPESWSALSNIAMHLSDELGAFLDDWESEGSMDP